MTATAILTGLMARGVRLLANGARLTIDAPASSLTDTDRGALREHKAELLAILSESGRCPACHEPANLQDRARDAWFCPACRLWADGQGKPLPKPERVRPLTLEEPQARKLLADLLAAGCGFVADGEELRLIHPGRMDAGMWARFDQAGAAFRRLARVEAEWQASADWGVSNKWTH